MSEKITCEGARQELQRLQGLEQSLTEVLDYASGGAPNPVEARQALKRASELRLQVEQGIYTLREKMNPFEALFELRRQYQTQVTILDKAGILEEREVNKEKIKGITDIEGRFHALPTEQEIVDRMREKKELLEKKKEQGFGRLLLVPFGMSLDTLAEKYQQVLLSHYEDMEDPSNPGNRIPDPSTTRLWGYTWNEATSQYDRTPIELDRNDPLYKWDRYENADTNGNIVYDVQEFSATNHQGKTKKEILTQQPKQAWDIIFVETNVNIPREGKGGASIGGRKQMETNKTAIDYLKLLQEDPQYQGEVGLRPEEWLILALSELEEKDEVIDDWDGNGSGSFNIGAFFPASSDVPSTFFRRVSRRAYLGGYYVDVPNGDFGVRSGVRV